MVHACNHSNPEAEAEVQGHSLLSTELEASLGYVRPCLKWRWDRDGGEKRERDGLN